MNVNLRPSLDGVAEERLHAFAIHLTDPRLSEDGNRKMVDRESSWAHRAKRLNGQSHAYDASARLLADLRLLKRIMHADNCGIEFQSSPNPRLKAKSASAATDSRAALRKELSPALAQPFADPPVREFIQSMEQPSRASRRQSIRSLIADGSRVAARLRPTLAATGEDRTVKP